MTEPDVLVAAAVTGLAWLVGGLSLLVGRRATPAAGLLAGAGAGLIAAAALAEAGQTPLARGLLVAAGLLVCPLALATYPRARWRHPVDFVALTTLGGSGFVALLGHRAQGGVVLQSSGLVTGLVLIAHTWWRLEHSSGRERRSLQWMALAAGAAGLAAGLVTFAGQSPAAYAVSVALFAALGPALYVGVAVPEVVDVRALVVGVVVLAVALLGYLATFVLLAGSVQVLGGGTALSLGVLGLVGGLVATTFHPVQVLLHGVVDELLFGTRPTRWTPRPASSGPSATTLPRRCARSARRSCCPTPPSSWPAGPLPRRVNRSRRCGGSPSPRWAASSWSASGPGTCG